MAQCVLDQLSLASTIISVAAEAEEPAIERRLWRYEVSRESLRRAFSVLPIVEDQVDKLAFSDAVSAVLRDHNLRDHDNALTFGDVAKFLFVVSHGGCVLVVRFVDAFSDRQPDGQSSLVWKRYVRPAVRNDREDRGNVGIIRSPVRASILPNSH